MSDPLTAPAGARPVRAPRGTARTARSWLTEAPLRMLMNNLDPEVAERPDDLVVYGGIGKAAGFVEMVRTELSRLAPVPTALRVSALGVDSVVDGCLASGLDVAWTSLAKSGRP